MPKGQGQHQKHVGIIIEDELGEAAIDVTIMMKMPKTVEGRRELGAWFLDGLLRNTIRKR